MFLYIVRHGEPDHTTGGLLPRGEKQAEAVAKRLFECGIDRIFSSPLKRARQSAEALCRLSGKEYTIADFAAEIEVQVKLPSGEERSAAALQNVGVRELGSEISLTEETRKCAQYIKSEGDVFLEALGYRYENGNYRILERNEQKVALFCHGNFARVWLSSLLNVPPLTMMTSFGYEHTGVTVLHF